MRLAPVALALVLPTAAAAEAPPPPKGAKASLCRDAFKVQPARNPDAARARRLGELPPGDLTRAVLNPVDGCLEPITVRHGHGAAC